MEYLFDIVPIAKLKEHEEIMEDAVSELIGAVKKDRMLRIPILVDKKSFVILDGHHRYYALKRIGCSKAPVYLVDYYDPAILLDLWDTATIDTITKEEVIEMGMSDEVYPPKTTRHRLTKKLDERPTKLDDLY